MTGLELLKAPEATAGEIADILLGQMCRRQSQIAELIGFRNHTKEVHGRFCFIDPPTEILPPSAECIRAVQQISHRKAAILGIYPSQAAVCKGVLDHQR